MAVRDELRPLAWAAALSGAFALLGWIFEGVGFAGFAVAAYLTAYIIGGFLRVRDGLAALKEGQVSIDMLMVLGATGAAVLGRWGEGAVLIFLFALSNYLEAYATGRTRQAIEAIMELRPDTARLVQADGGEVQVAVTALELGDQVLVRPGERLPVDGEVVYGRSAVDQAPITGESVPVEKEPGSTVFAGTLNGQGLLTVEVTRLATESTLSRVIQLVEEAQEHKAKSQRLTEWIDRYYTLLVIGVALVAWLLPPLALGSAWGSSFYLAMQLLVVMSPCALVIATPAALLSAVAAGARRGMLFKGGVHLEQAGLVQAVAFDKTGTLTKGRPVVQGAIVAPGVTETELLGLVAAAEANSGHPLAQALLRAAAELDVPTANEVQELPGFGVMATVGGRQVKVGSRRLVEHPWLHSAADELEAAGQTSVLVEVDGEPFGAIGIADELRPEAAKAIAELRRVGVQHIIMLTGDHPVVAAAVAAQVGVDEFYADLLPEEKLAKIHELRDKYGTVAMVGDGVNDAPALAAASLGVAMGGAGNDAALESADVVLMANDLRKLAEMLHLGRVTRRTVIQNLTFAGLTIVGLVAATFFGSLSLPLAVVGHEGSTILVSLNGLRLLLSGRRRGTPTGGQPARQVAA